jgi:hypothetical protein
LLKRTFLDKRIPLVMCLLESNIRKTLEVLLVILYLLWLIVLIFIEILPGIGSVEMALHVEGEMIGTGETTLAAATFEWLRSGVLAIVSRQFVGPGEPPVTTVPTAVVGFLTGVCPLVGFQVGGLGVHFLT